jgi:uncharacterized protein YcbX
MATVAWIATTPVKALAVDLVDEIDLTADGPRGDRLFYLVDENDRLVSNKGLGILQQVHGTFDEQTRVLSMRLPDGSVVEAAVELGEEAETGFSGRSRKVARRVSGPWAEALSELTGKTIALMASDKPAVDRGRRSVATLLSTGSLRALGGELEVDDVDSRRFRMHFGVDGVEPHAEDGWIGKEIRIGDAVVIPQGNVGRCAVTTQNPETGKPDLDTLKALARYRGELDTTEPLAFGVYATVAQPGRVRVGDPVELP